MLSFMTKSKVTAFIAVAMVTIAFLAVHYVGLDRFIGGYQVTVDMPEAGGLFKNSEVTYRGVPVGRVESLTAEAGGARAIVRINPGSPEMPAEVTARVVDRSAIGEQYLDLRGGALDGAKLADGAHITMTEADLPPKLDSMLRSSRDFIASVPSKALNTVIDEGYDFTRGNGQNLARLLKTSSEFAKTADRNFLLTASLIDNSGTVLATQEKVASSFQSYAKDMDLLAHSFSAQDKDWRKLVEQTPAAARQLDELFRTVGQPLGQLMANLVSTAEVFGTNAAGVKETMIRLPEGISITYAVMTSQGMRSGLEPTFFTPPPCTKGYEDTPMRGALDTSPGKPFNLKAGCAMSPSSGVDVRGPQAVLGDSHSTRLLGTADSLRDLMGGKQ